MFKFSSLMMYGYIIYIASQTEANPTKPPI